MKKSLCLLLIWVAGPMLFAQVSTFQIRDNNNGGQLVNDGQTFYHPTQNYGPTINHEFEIKNVSAGTLSLSLRKYEDLMNTVNVTNSDVAQAYFCFGTNCLPASVFSYSIELMPGESTLLEAKFDEASVAGHSQVRFKFNNKVNTADALTLTLKYDSNVGIATIDKNEDRAYLVYPNPATDQLTVASTGNNNKIIEIRLQDALGKTVLRCKQEDIGDGAAVSLPLEALPAGIYLLNIDTQTQTIHKKITIN